METLYASLALCEGNPLATDGFPSQRASNVELHNMVMAWYVNAISRTGGALYFLYCQLLWSVFRCIFMTERCIFILIKPKIIPWCPICKLHPSKCTCNVVCTMAVSLFGSNALTPPCVTPVPRARLYMACIGVTVVLLSAIAMYWWLPGAAGVVEYT